jgi:hypothetical protein
VAVPCYTERKKYKRDLKNVDISSAVAVGEERRIGTSQDDSKNNLGLFR